MSKEIVKRPIDALKSMLESVSVQEQFKNALGGHKDLFYASLIDAFNSGLQDCDPKTVITESLKAAVLRLPITKALGAAYLVPYNRSFKDENGQWKKVKEAQFQIGYKGLVQLAMRTGQLKTINAGAVFDGEAVTVDRLSGKTMLSGERSGDGEIGYFSYLELINGFEKCLYITKGEVFAHGERYSPSFTNKKSLWVTDFTVMAIKTITKRLFSRYAPLSIEIVSAINHDSSLTNEPVQVGQIEHIEKPEPLTPELQNGETGETEVLKPY